MKVKALFSVLVFVGLVSFSFAESTGITECDSVILEAEKLTSKDKMNGVEGGEKELEAFKEFIVGFTSSDNMDKAQVKDFCTQLLVELKKDRPEK